MDHVNLAFSFKPDTGRCHGRFGSVRVSLNVNVELVAPGRAEVCPMGFYLNNFGRGSLVVSYDVFKGFPIYLGLCKRVR